MTRAREDLVQSRVALADQLRAELERFWPGPIGLFSDLDNLISLAFLKRYPSPADARGLGEQRLRAFLTRERYSGHKPPAEVLAKLRRAPEGRAGALEGQARRAVVLSSPASAGPATSGCEAPSTRSPTPPATGTPGPPTTTPARSLAATTTPARPAPSAAPGAASSGAAGRTARHMTRPATTPRNNMPW